MDTYSFMILKEHADNLFQFNQNSIIVIDELENMINIDEELFNNQITKIKNQIINISENINQFRNNVNSYIIKKENEENNK
ncbi:MAG: hypothetical protein ACFFG0_05260 [Candidatus Thorarchaeota archaeon]